jgi:cytochrome P450
MARDFPDDVEPAEDALLGNGMLILVAGHETTANMMELSVLTLLEWPDQLAVMRGVGKRSPPRSRSCSASTP